MLKHLAPVTLIALAAPLAAQAEISAMIASDGLIATEAHLDALSDPGDAELFALGGVRFLRGVETALQTRYRTGIAEQAGMVISLPVLRLPIPENPAPEPFSPELITVMFEAILSDMVAAGEPLTRIEGEFGLRINTADIWFDINDNGRRDPGEELTRLLDMIMGMPMPPITVNFDRADGEWLRAYSHLIAGTSELVLAFDPTEVIAEVQAASTGIAALNAEAGSPWGTGWGDQFGAYADYAAIVLNSLQRQPDPARTNAALDHWLTTIEANRAFWRLVAQETDNDAEWIPNKLQVSATGLVFPPETGTAWQAVLSEAEAVLRGEALIPHWRLAEGAGIDLAAMFRDPPPIDLIGIAHGMDILPYATTGRLVSGESLWMFSALMGGDAPLFMVMLN